MPAPTDASTPRSPSSLLLACGTLALLVVGAMGPLLRNDFVQDDFGIIVRNALVHDWSGLWRAFTVPYWPDLNIAELYRPLSTGWLTVQWIAGGGHPLLFRVVSLLLYLASILVLWRLLRLYVGEGPAWIAAALFAVHPVHVETLAVAVNQSEFLVAILLVAAVTLRVRANRGEIPIRRAELLIGALFLVGIFTKEHALVLPGLLLAADHWLDRGTESLAQRLKVWRWNYLSLFLLALLFWIIRTRVLGGGSGTLPAEALERSGMLQRAYTMVGVPAEWLSLLVWPSHLQADWNLLEWVPTHGWSLRETAGAIALLSFLLAFGLAWKRRPLTAFGLGWMVVALAPVSNVLIPSGIILAERTLYLASIGLAFVVADLSGIILVRWDSLARIPRLAVTLVVALLLALGALRSELRLAGWLNRPIYLAVAAADAPTSWRARIAWGLYLAEFGDTAGGRKEIHAAIALRPEDPLVGKAMLDRMRLERGECAGPVIGYQELLAVLPGRSDVRGSTVACLMWLGQYAEARAEAARGVARHLDADYFREVMLVADSAAAAHAPAGTVRLRSVGARATVVGVPDSTGTAR